MEGSLLGTGGQLPVYICEYHDEALRCLHHAIRRRVLPFADIALVHLDSHPDLGAPDTVAAETICTSPHDLYDALRSDKGGIAQWILPAVYAGHLSSIWWVRPEWATQIRDGDFAVAVGCAAKDPTAQADRQETVKISCAEPYFVEDGIYCSLDRMQAAQKLRLLVATDTAIGVQERITSFLSRTSRTNAKSNKLSQCVWVLDVCLDYFICGNPHLDQVRQDIVLPFSALYNAPTFRQGPVTDATSFTEQRQEFERLYKAVLETLVNDADRDDTEEQSCPSAAAQALIVKLCDYLPSNEKNAVMACFLRACREAQTSELRQLLEAGDMVSLPLHRVKTEVEVTALLQNFDAFLAHLAGIAGCPRAVTIARSVVDGFCPMRWHCFLETGVLEVLKQRFGNLTLLYSDELDAMDNLTLPGR